MNRLRKAITLELGPFAIVVYVAIFLNALVLCLDHAESSAQTERVLAGVRIRSATSWGRGCGTKYGAEITAW